MANIKKLIERMNFSKKHKHDFIIISDYIDTDNQDDVSEKIQRIIDENPNRTIYFPDGVYTIEQPIYTPALPSKSVDLQLSNYAVIKASDNWNHKSAMICLGGKEAANNIVTNGSNYSLTGGIIDGNGIADGVSIDSGRETAIRDVSIKHTRIGIHIKKGANNLSSDADIMGVNIVGNGTTESIGVLIEGFDNTLTNMRIANVFTGVHLKAQGNFLRNIHPLYTSDYTNYLDSCGFRDEEGSNWYNMCYSDHFGIGFYNKRGTKSIYDSCFCMWYSPKGEKHTAFKAEGQFNSVVTNLKIGFCDASTENIILEVGEDGGIGIFERIFTEEDFISNCSHEKYLCGGIL